MAMIGRRGAMLAKERPALAQRCQVALPVRGIFPGQLPELPHIRDEIHALWVGHVVGPKGSNDAAAPAGFGDRPMVFERIESAFGRRQQLDAEGIVERAWS